MSLGARHGLTKPVRPTYFPYRTENQHTTHTLKLSTAELIPRFVAKCGVCPEPIEISQVCPRGWECISRLKYDNGDHNCQNLCVISHVMSRGILSNFNTTRIKILDDITYWCVVSTWHPWLVKWFENNQQKVEQETKWTKNLARMVEGRRIVLEKLLKWMEELVPGMFLYKHWIEKFMILLASFKKLMSKLRLNIHGYKKF